MRYPWGILLHFPNEETTWFFKLKISISFELGSFFLFIFLPVISMYC